MSKDEVRSLARKWNLHTAERKESMGICFIGTRDRFGNFLGEILSSRLPWTRSLTFLRPSDSYLEPKPGDIEDATGRVVGKHSGLWRYTIGEGARLSGFPAKMYVGRKDIERNRRRGRP
jgi:tRNA U34 2-thiouridine synthase MnmA/TrmU